MLIIDVSEQRIEHPLKHQKSILFRQKTWLRHQSTTCYLCFDAINFKCCDGKRTPTRFYSFQPVDYCSIQIRNYLPIRVIKELLGITWTPSFHSKRKKDSPLPQKKNLIIKRFQKNAFWLKTLTVFVSRSECFDTIAIIATLSWRLFMPIGGVLINVRDIQ
jgi:hypothetical protein